LRKGQPSQDRVSELHQKLYGSPVRAGDGGDSIHAVQQLVYLEESCQDILEAIKAMEEGASDSPNPMDELRSSLTFVARLADDRELLRTLTYRQQRR
jgi:hypothetical protein